MTFMPARSVRRLVNVSTFVFVLYPLYLYDIENLHFDLSMSPKSIEYTRNPEKYSCSK